MLGLDSDRIVSSPDLDNMGPQEKRRLCQIDDVCSCFRRDVFLRYKYAVGLAYAEESEKHADTALGLPETWPILGMNRQEK